MDNNVLWKCPLKYSGKSEKFSKALWVLGIVKEKVESKTVDIILLLYKWCIFKKLSAVLVFQLTNVMKN